MSPDLAAVDVHPHDLPAVGPFTGFANLLGKEFRDWWLSWRMLIVFGVMTFLLTIMVFFAFTKTMKIEREFLARAGTPPSDQVIATHFVLSLVENTPFPNPALILQIFIMIFSTMGIMTTEKSTGTLAWNLTKPVGRTGLFFAKWLAAASMLWLSMCVLPTVVACICMSAYHHITPDIGMIAPIVGAAFAWVGLWVLLSLTVSLGFQSQAAVAGIVIAFWAVPNLFGILMDEVIGHEAMTWVVDRLATNSPFWAWDMIADDQLFILRAPPVGKHLFYYAYAGWMIGLSALSVTIFNRQEIGS